MKRPEVVDKIAAELRQIAEQDEYVICWWCGDRPIDGKWEADHIFPLLGMMSDMAAACAKCNRRKQQRNAWAEQKERLFWSSRVVRTCTAEECREIAKTQSIKLFGSTEWIGLLIAATMPNKHGKTKPVFMAGGGQRRDRAANAKLQEVGLL